MLVSSEYVGLAPHSQNNLWCVMDWCTFRTCATNEARLAVSLQIFCHEMPLYIPGSVLLKHIQISSVLQRKSIYKEDTLRAVLKGYNAPKCYMGFWGGGCLRNLTSY